MHRTTATKRPAQHHPLLLTIFAAGMIFANPTPTIANQPKSKTAATPHKKGTGNKPTYQRSSSEESSAERDRRLYRECKGLPNAGACLGYARGK